MKKQLPPPAPPCTGGETNARKRHDTTVQRILPLCKGGARGGSQSVDLCGRNHKSKIIKSKIETCLISQL